MAWVRILAYITGSFDQELLLRNEYLATEDRILTAQIKGRFLLSDAETKTLAEITHRLGPKRSRRSLASRISGPMMCATVVRRGWCRQAYPSRPLLSCSGMRIFE